MSIHGQNVPITIHGQNVPITIHGKNNPTKNIVVEKFMDTENQNNPSVPSITLVFNLLALHNKLYPKSLLMVCVFFLLNFSFV